MRSIIASVCIAVNMIAFAFMMGLDLYLPATIHFLAALVVGIGEDMRREKETKE